MIISKSPIRIQERIKSNPRLILSHTAKNIQPMEDFLLKNPTIPKIKYIIISLKGQPSSSTSSKDLTESIKARKAVEITFKKIQSKQTEINDLPYTLLLKAVAISIDCKKSIRQELLVEKERDRNS